MFLFILIPANEEAMIPAGRLPRGEGEEGSLRAPGGRVYGVGNGEGGEARPDCSFVKERASLCLENRRETGRVLLCALRQRLDEWRTLCAI